MSLLRRLFHKMNTWGKQYLQKLKLDYYILYSSWKLCKCMVSLIEQVIP